MTLESEVLFSFAVSPDALLSYNTPRDKITHTSAAKIVLNNGILRLGPGDETKLNNAIGNLIGKPSSAWREAITALNQLRRVDSDALPQPIEQFIKTNARHEGSANHVRLAIVTDSDVSASTDQQPGPNRTELVKLLDFADSHTVGRALSPISFNPGASRDRVGDRVLRPLASRSREVTVFDPYLFDDVVGTSGAKPPRNHLEWLTEVFSRSLPNSATLRFIGHLPTAKRDAPPVTPALFQEKIDVALQSSLRNRRQELTIEATAYSGSVSAVKASNRYLLFSCGFDFEVTHDIPRLGHPKIPAPDALTFHQLRAGQRERAKEIIQGYLDYEPKGLVKWTHIAPSGTAMGHGS